LGRSTIIDVSRLSSSRASPDTAVAGKKFVC
jgi:hypothetical protein